MNGPVRRSDSDAEQHRESGVLLETRPWLGLYQLATSSHPELCATPATEPQGVLNHRVSDAYNHEGIAAARTHGRIGCVVLLTVSQQLAAFGAVEQHSGFVNAFLGHEELQKVDSASMTVAAKMHDDTLVTSLGARNARFTAVRDGIDVQRLSDVGRHRVLQRILRVLEPHAPFD